MNKTAVENSINNSSDICNEALRQENKIVAEYNYVLRKFSAENLVDELLPIRNEHRKSIGDLGQLIMKIGGIPDQIPVTDIPISASLGGVEKLFGKSSAVEILKNHEVMLLEEYEARLDCRILVGDCVNIFATILLPRVQSHLAKIGKLEEIA
ncbi:MAG: ferritin-like domain-containing protein [Verrucomicrobiales bacterium]|nr:ferritin-like domain-containing protein [Verrucomicrobiales bacterium]